MSCDTIPLEQVIKQVAYDKLKVAVQSRLDMRDCDFVRNHLEMSSRIDHMVRQMVLELTSFVLGKRGKSIDIKEKWPANWWQAVRERWLPAWWLRKHPVQYKRVSVHESTWRVCPHLNVKTAGYQAHFQYLETGQ